MTRLYSYVVRYDSGFAPNPFFGYCSLATCKPQIRENASLGDWILGTGSAASSVQRGGHMVYAMRVTDILSFEQFDADARFQAKKPFRRGSRQQSCGDNIYYRNPAGNAWCQRDSFHTNNDGSLHAKHVQIDTDVNRVLISSDFVYFGGDGPDVPPHLRHPDGRSLVHTGRGRSCLEDEARIGEFVSWVRSLGVCGWQGLPFEWIFLRAKANR